MEACDDWRKLYVNRATCGSALRQRFGNCIPWSFSPMIGNIRFVIGCDVTAVVHVDRPEQGWHIVVLWILVR